MAELHSGHCNNMHACHPWTVPLPIGNTKLWSPPGSKRLNRWPQTWGTSHEYSLIISLTTSPGLHPCLVWMWTHDQWRPGAVTCHICMIFFKYLLAVACKAQTEHPITPVEWPDGASNHSSRRLKGRVLALGLAFLCSTSTQVGLANICAPKDRFLTPDYCCCSLWQMGGFTFILLIRLEW
jgi:hypothetical protein